MTWRFLAVGALGLAGDEADPQVNRNLQDHVLLVGLATVLAALAARITVRADVT